MSSTEISVTPKMLINTLLRLDYLGWKTRIQDIVQILSRSFPICSNRNKLQKEVAIKLRCCIAAGLVTRCGSKLIPTARGKRYRLYKSDLVTFWNVYKTLSSRDSMTGSKAGDTRVQCRSPSVSSKRASGSEQPPKAKSPKQNSNRVKHKDRPVRAQSLKRRASKGRRPARVQSPKVKSNRVQRKNRPAKVQPSKDKSNCAKTENGPASVEPTRPGISRAQHEPRCKISNRAPTKTVDSRTRNKTAAQERRGTVHSDAEDWSPDSSIDDDRTSSDRDVDNRKKRDPSNTSSGASNCWMQEPRDH